MNDQKIISITALGDKSRKMKIQIGYDHLSLFSVKAILQSHLPQTYL